MDLDLLDHLGAGMLLSNRLTFICKSTDGILNAMELQCVLQKSRP